MNALDKNQDDFSRKAKRYSSIKYTLAIIETVYLLVLLFIFVGFGLSGALVQAIQQIIPQSYFLLPVYLLIASLGYYSLSFPLNFYGSYILEHKFSLSNQKTKDWLKDQFKAGIIAYIIALILVSAFYFILNRYPHIWWLVVSLFWIFFSLILAKLIPVIIIPLFFKYKPMSDNVLRERIINLAKRMKIKILDCFEIDFSKKTRKANAAFVGMGRTKRVILADTLKDKYTYDEIEVILAHEFSHYRLRHLLKIILVNSIGIILSLYLIFKTSGSFLRFFNLPSLSNISALPLIIIYMILLGVVIQPLENYLSRRFERNADIMALEETNLKEAFISMMEKLATQNLADRNPHPLIKIFFFNHPPIDERIATATNWHQVQT